MNQAEFMQVLKYIEENLQNQITLDKIASHMGYSRFYFSRNFKEFSGTSVMKYVTRRKMIRAAEKIRQGRKILDVALEFDYESHSCFSKTFKREMGYHPSLLKAEKDLNGGMAMERKGIEERKTKEELFEILKQGFQKEYDSEKLDKCYCEMCDFYDGQKRYSGEEYVIHPLHTAIILEGMEAEEKVILAGMFCDFYTRGKETAALEKQLPPEVWEVLTELKEKSVAEMSDEALLVYIAARLHNMQTIEFMDPGVWKSKAEETMAILAIVRGRIGDNKITDNLNSLAMKYLK